MPAFNRIPFTIKVSHFQGLPVEIQDFLLSDEKSEQLKELAKNQGLEENNWIKLNDLVWGVFLREIDLTILEQGISEYVNIEPEKAKTIGESIRKTMLVQFSDFFAQKKKTQTSVPKENVVDLKSKN